jgi:hypothetical protein
VCFLERAARQDPCSLAKEAKLSGSALCNLQVGELKVTCLANLDVQIKLRCGNANEVIEPPTAKDVADHARKVCPGNGQAAFDVVLAAENDRVQLNLFAANHFSACKAAFENAKYVIFLPNICQVVALQTVLFELTNHDLKWKR